MNNTRLCVLLFAAALACAGPLRADCDFDEFPLLEGMQVASIAENMQWNNVPMSVKGFQVEAPLEAVKGFYGERWEGEVDFSEFGPWQQIMHLTEDCMMMVQLQGQGTQSMGRLMLVNPPDEEMVSRPLGSGVPIPPDAAVVSDMQNQDRFRDGQMVMLASSSTLEDSVGWYESEMARNGWQLNRRLVRQNDATLIYSEGREQLSIVFLRHQEFTQILLNRMDR